MQLFADAAGKNIWPEIFKVMESPPWARARRSRECPEAFFSVYLMSVRTPFFSRWDIPRLISSYNLYLEICLSLAFVRLWDLGSQVNRGGGAQKLITGFSSIGRSNFP